MNYLILNVALLLALSGSGLKAKSFSEKPLGVELRAQDGSLRARVFVGKDSLLLDFPFQQRGYLFKPDSFVYLNRGDKTYRVHSYANMLSNLQNRANSDTLKQEGSRDVGAAGFELTGETDVIAGFDVTKIVRRSNGKVEMEIWVSEEMTPLVLRAIGRQIRAILPTNYWSDDNPTPTLIQATLMFGLPLRIVDHETEIRAVAMKNDEIPEDQFEVPSEYRNREP